MSGQKGSIIIALVDFLTALVAVFIAKAVSIHLPGLSLPDKLLFEKALILASILIICYHYQDLYNRNYLRSLPEILSSMLIGSGTMLFSLGLLYYLVPGIGLDREVLLVALAIIFFEGLGLRMFYVNLLYRKYGKAKVIILGSGRSARHIVEEVSDNYTASFIGYVGRGAGSLQLKYLGTIEDLPDIVDRLGPDKLVVALDDRRGNLPFDILLQIKTMGCDVVDTATFYEELTGKILVEEIRPSSLIFSRGFMHSKFMDISKRVFDVFLALFIMVFASPVMLITAIAIYLESGWPVFYLQDRVGFKGKDFSIIKFRSMVRDAEKHGPRWCEEGDPRITRVGRFIRKTRIDELPQVINVLRNEMSFVGPRPERRFFIKQLEENIPYYGIRLNVKPGVTGWAQINYPYGDSVEDAKEKLKYELYYMKNRSLWLDLVIILQTIKIMLKGRGSQ